MTAAYDLGVAKIGVAYFTQKQTGVVDAKGTQVFATVPLNAQLSLLANFGQNDSASTAAFNTASPAATLDSKISAVGLKYTFSKTTSVYARYVDQTFDGVASSATTVAKKVQTTAIGMMTSF